MSTILCVVAHPDDETLGAGGTIARHAENGEAVHILVLADGVMARYDERTAEAESAIERRRSQARTAVDTLGAESITFCEFPDNELDSISLLTLVKRIEESISKHQPDTIYTHHYGDLNVDHKLVCRAVMTAARPLDSVPTDRILAFETLSASEWGLPEQSNAFQPTSFVDISDTLSVKMEAIEAYSDELRSGPHPRSRDAIEQCALLWGQKSGVQAAEAFVLMRERI